MPKKSTDSTQDEKKNADLETEVELDDESKDDTVTDDEDTQDENDEETEDESDDSDDEDEEDEDSDDEDEEDSEGFKKRLTQFKGDTPAEYAKNLEDGYLETSKEGVRLSKENKKLKEVMERVNQAVATNPELAKLLQDGAGDNSEKPPAQTKDPALAWAEAERDKQWQKDYDKFLGSHPEIETDPMLAEKLNTQLAVVRDVVQRTEGRLVGMKEGLEKAWKLLDRDDTEEKVRMAAKDAASKGRTASGKKSDANGKVKFTDSQIQVTMDMMGVDRNAAIKLMSEYNK